MSVTNHLQSSEVLFPPDILLELRSHGGDHVIKVHDDVYKSVKKSEEGAVAARGKLHAHPDRRGHDAVMNDV